MSKTWCRTGILAHGAPGILVPKSRCFTDVFEQEKLVFVKNHPLATKTEPRVYPQRPIGTTMSMKGKLKICS